MSQQKIKIVHFSDLHFGSGERYGSLNPETGLNKRFEDFILALDKPINFSIENNVDLVIFTGDTYKHATPEPIYQNRFASKIKKLSEHGIPTILLVGNHDVLYRVDASNALDIYKSLDIENVTVFNKIELKEIKTKNGTVQIVSLPHITKSKLLTKEENRDLSPKEQDDLMLLKVKEAINGAIKKINPDMPAILIGHGTIENAVLGGEQELSIGKVLSYPLSLFQKSEIDYVGFGHIHKHQILQSEKPLILYAGSVERVDFGEENEDKGFIYLEMEKGKNLNHKFISTNPRKFITISVDLTNSENLQFDLEKAILTEFEKDAVLRIRYKISDYDLQKVDLNKIKELLKNSFYYTIQPEIIKKERAFRIADFNPHMITSPISALEKYLFDSTAEEKEILLNKAKELIEESKRKNIS